MYQIYPVSDTPGGDAWLILTPRKAALYEAGYAFSAPSILDNLRRLLQGRPLDYILLTHSHYDHASGAARIKQAYPEAQVTASAYCARVVTRPGAIRTMREMNDNAAPLYGLYPYEDLLDQLRVDRTVADGDVIDLEDVKLTVWETPGHTKCSISFFSDDGLLLMSETMGALAEPPEGKGEFLVAPACMVGHGKSLAAIRRAIEAKPNRILLAHYQVVDGELPMQYLNRSLYWHERGRDLLVEGWQAGKSIEELTRAWKDLFYTPAVAKIQPEAAFDLNAVYIIPSIIKEYLGEDALDRSADRPTSGGQL